MNFTSATSFGLTQVVTASSFTRPDFSGKSLLTLEWAAALALGPVEAGRTSFCGLDVRERVNVLVINAEDDTAEMRKRLGGAIKEFGLPDGEVVDRVFLQSSQDAGSPSFIVAKRNKKTGEVEETPDAQNLIDFIIARDIGAVFVDPYVDTHTTQESDNGDANAVMRIYKRIASETNAAVALVHHTRKPSAASSESYAGNPDSARGAGAIINAARVAATLYPMSEKDGVALHIAKAIRHRYVRLDDAKANYSLAGPDAEWFEKRTVQLPNGDEVGVLAPVALAKANAVEPARENLEAVYARLVVATESGEWEKLSCSPLSAKHYLPKAFSGEPGLLEWAPVETIEAAMLVLERARRAERVRHGRPNRSGEIPERWKAIQSG
ncbi:MAG: AAA family ATPase [Burkholderiales bacterium]